jgi:hypothetical protein
MLFFSIKGTLYVECEPTEETEEDRREQNRRRPTVGIKRSSWISFGFDGELREQSFHQKEGKSSSLITHHTLLLNFVADTTSFAVIQYHAYDPIQL